VKNTEVVCLTADLSAFTRAGFVPSGRAAGVGRVHLTHTDSRVMDVLLTLATDSIPFTAKLGADTRNSGMLMASDGYRIEILLGARRSRTKPSSLLRYRRVRASFARLASVRVVEV
jgi:hypothetical protein